MAPGRLAGRLHGRPTALLVPVPAAAGLRPPAPGGLPPHVTVLYPWLRRRRVGEADLGALRALAAGTPAFDFGLVRVERFPRVLYLAPEPAAPFVALTEACAERWPDHPPFGGAFAEIVPHLTLAEGEEPAGLAERAQAAVPLRTRAEELWLAEQADGGWRLREAFPLGREG